VGVPRRPRTVSHRLFAESLATPKLIIFAIRTRRLPFFRNRPTLTLTLAALGVVTVGAIPPAAPLAHTWGFQPLPAGYLTALAGMVAAYLTLVEVGKRLFYRTSGPVAVPKPTVRAARFRNGRRPARQHPLQTDPRT
jgi:P-type Mg2+ transporter